MPSKQFKPLFIDDSASAYLHLLYQNNARAPHVEGLALAYAHTKVLEVPDSSIKAEILGLLLKACREHLRLNIDYISLNSPKPEGPLRSIPSSTQACADMCVLTAKKTASTGTLY